MMGFRYLAVLVLTLSIGNVAMALEEPEYMVVLTQDAYEIRRYEPYIVAEVDVDAESERRAGNSAFRILAGYIFGDNREQQKMAMTAPVESQRHGVRMKMTAPVESSANTGSYTYAFVMERKYTLDTLPEPVDERIRIREKPARYVAARRYSGSWSEKKYRQIRDELDAALTADGIEKAGNHTLARYNSPFAPPFMRRNEVLVDVAWSDTVRSAVGQDAP